MLHSLILWSSLHILDSVVSVCRYSIHELVVIGLVLGTHRLILNRHLENLSLGLGLDLNIRIRVTQVFSC